MSDDTRNLAEIARKKRHLHLIEKLHGGKSLTKQEIQELEDFEAKPLDPNVVVDLDDVARAMDVTYRTVQRWKQDGMPVTREGYYNLEEVKKWYLKKNKRRSNLQGKDYWDEKISKYKASLLELELKKIQGELIPKEEVEHARIARIIAVKRSFFALPTRMAPLLSMKEPMEIEALLYEAIGEIVDEFTGARKLHDSGEILDEAGRQSDLDRGGDSGVDAPAEDHGQ